MSVSVILSLSLSVNFYSYQIRNPNHSANAIVHSYWDLLCVSFFVMAQIFEYNGSALIAMVGKNCFAIASDRRLGVQLQTIATDFQRIYKVHDRLFLGLSGLATDAQTLYQSIADLHFFFFFFNFEINLIILILMWRYQRLVFRHKLYQLREERDMKPETFASLVSAILYEKRCAINKTWS